MIQNMWMKLVVLLIIISVFISEANALCSSKTKCGKDCWTRCGNGILCSSHKDCVSGNCAYDKVLKTRYCAKTGFKSPKPPKPQKPQKSSKPSKTKQVKNVKSKEDSKTSSQIRFSTTSMQKTIKSPLPSNANSRLPVWTKPDFSNGLGDWSVELDSYGKSNRKYVSDPAGGSDIVLQVLFPSGSRNPSGPIVGGTGFYSAPVDLKGIKSVEFSFMIYASEGFNWVKGGKLPGLYGGKRSCSGGNSALDCFSTRFMWRTAGLGEIYLYVPLKMQDPDFCRIPPLSICNPSYGNSLGRGAFAFQTGQWNLIRQVITLNTISDGFPNKNGKVQVFYGESHVPVISFDKIVWRVMDNVEFIGIDFETFFGGSDSTWVSPFDQHLYFKGFKLRALS